ncbi:MAG: hypothetical protein R3A11_01600 [Bdellovibrionota bacterium]
MSSLRLEYTQSKTIPFHGNREITYHEGLVYSSESKKLRFTFSDAAFLGKYRVSLHILEPEDPTPYLFSIDEVRHIIESENPESTQVWGDPTHEYHLLFAESLKLLIHDRLSNT